MDRAHGPAQHPAHLALGTVVGPWRVVAWAGRGVYGAVYNAVRVEEAHGIPVALKVALLPGDPRFALRPPAQMRPRRAWFAMAAASLSLAAWAWWVLPSKSMEKPAIVRRESASASQQDGSTMGLGDAASTASTVASPESPAQEAVAGDTPPEPQPGQIRPDAAGKCPHKRQVALNGACWAPLKEEREECEAASGQMFKDHCYVPVMLPGRPPPFSPANAP